MKRKMMGSAGLILLIQSDGSSPMVNDSARPRARPPCSGVRSPSTRPPRARSTSRGRASPRPGERATRRSSRDASGRSAARTPPCPRSGGWRASVRRIFSPSLNANVAVRMRRPPTLAQVIHDQLWRRRIRAEKPFGAARCGGTTNAAQACDRAWGWGPHAAFAEDKPEPRFSGLKRGFSVRLRIVHPRPSTRRMTLAAG